MPTFTKRNLLSLAAMPLLLGIVTFAGALTPAEIPFNPSTDESLPAETAYRFTLPGLPNGDVSLDSYAGERNVVLVFYRGFW